MKNTVKKRLDAQCYRGTVKGFAEHRVVFPRAEEIAVWALLSSETSVIVVALP